MPIEGRITIAETGEVMGLKEDIGPGNRMAFSDGQDTLIVTCNAKDDGGRIERYTQSEVDKIMAGTSPSSGGLGKLVARIGMGESCSVPAASPTLGQVTLEFTHIERKEG